MKPLAQVWLTVMLAALLLGSAGALRAADVIINEFMALNSSGLRDRDGDTSDWIELYNASSGTVNLAGWRLTDRVEQPSRWIFPATNLPSRAFLVVFASGKNRAQAGSELHTDFELRGGGEYLALIRPDGSVATEFAPAFPIQFPNMSYGYEPSITTTTYVPANAAARYLVPADGTLGTNWAARAFDDSAWPTGVTGVGYETSGQDDFEDLIRTRLPIPTRGAYLRLAFESAGAGSPDILTLRAQYDDGFVAYLNGGKVGSTNAPALPDFDSLAPAERPNSEAVLFQDHDISAHAGRITSGTNILALHVLNNNDSLRNSDLLLLPVLDGLRYELGVSETLRYFHQPTPGSRNPLGYSGVSAEPSFSLAAGLYTNSQTLTLAAGVTGTVIRYTLDGSDPGPSSPVYAGPLDIRSRAGESNVYSQIRTQGAPESWMAAWRPPAGEVFKGTVVRARAFEPGRAASRIATRTYFVDAQMDKRYATLPVISIVSDPSNLFSHTSGIYVPGVMFTGNPRSGNYHMGWERPADIEFFETNGALAFAQSVGIKVHGATSCACAQKGLHVIARGAYGDNRIRYPVFHSLPTRAGGLKELKRFILRAWGSYQHKAMLYDPFAQMLFAHTELDIQSYRPAVVFINGEYWGLHEMREANQNSWYMQQYYGVDREDPGYDMIDGYSQLDEGDWTHWSATTAFINTQDVTDPAVYEQVKTLVDVDNLILYVLHSCFVNHGDWPNQNEGKWRPRTAGGRWRWLPFDFDHSFHDSWSADMIARARSYQAPFAKLIQNTEFRHAFINAYADHLNSSFRNDVMVERFNAMVQELRPYMPEQVNRWQLNADWNYWLGDMSNKIVMRATYELPNLMSEFGLTATSRVTLSVSPPGGGTIRINTLEVDENAPGVSSNVYPWQGLYFPGVPVALTAIPRRGYRFAGWEGGAAGATGTVTLALSNSVGVTATFAEFDPAQNAVVISEVMYRPAAEPGWPDADAFEFIELHNRSGAPVDLASATFTKGIAFTFRTNLLVAAGGYVVLVKDPAAFGARYDTNGMVVAGVYEGSLANGGEAVALRTAVWGPVVSSFEYRDARGWPAAADGAGHSLVPRVLHDQISGALDYGGNWRASAYRHGSPGRADPEPVRDVVLNEVLAHTDYADPAHPEYDSNDWLELFNRTAEAVPLAGWYLSDDAADLKKWAIPGTNVMAAGSWLCFDEVTGFHSPLTNGFGINKDGETLFLSYLPGTAEDRVADAVRLKGQEGELSAGRYEDGAAWWYALAPTPGAANAPPAAQVTISEVMYHPAPTAAHPEDNTFDEYVELHNPGAAPANLWNEAGTWRLDGGVAYRFPSNTTIAARGFLLLVSFDPSDAAALEDFLHTYSLARAQVTVLGPYAGQLSNSGERIALERPQAADLPGEPVSWVIVDEVIYSDGPPWPEGADGAGGSLRRAELTRSGNDPANWLVDRFASPGMPAAKIALASPRSGATYLLPLRAEARAVLDESQVTGSVRYVEFWAGTNLVATDTDAPYACELDALIAGAGEPGTLVLSAVMVDDGGTSVSPESVINLAAIANGGVTDVVETTAVARGALSGPGTVQAAVYWGAADGGTDAGAWERCTPAGTVGAGSFGARLEGLVLGRTYRYRWYGATDCSEGWAEATDQFTVSYNAWTNRMQVTFLGYDRGERLTNFPVLVRLGPAIAGFRYADFRSAAGADLRFLNAERTTALKHEIEEWNTNGVSTVWVQVPELAGRSDHVWAYWGNPAATSPPPYGLNGAVWSEGYQAVWHLHGGLGEATSNQVAVTNVGTVAAEGVAGEGRLCDGEGDYLHPGLGAAWYGQHVSNLTVSLWVKPVEVEAGTAFGTFMGGRDWPLYVNARGGRWVFAVQSPGNTNGAHVVVPGQWQMLTLVLNRGQAYAYRDGRREGPVLSYPAFTPLRDPLIGNLGGQTGTTAYCFHGTVDEVRIATAARSDAWVWASYMTVASNDAFTSYSIPRPPVPWDEDRDGMADAWETDYFGGTNAVPDGDEDGDGHSNLAEYWAGTSPTNAAERFALDLTFSDGVGAVVFQANAATGTHYPNHARQYWLQGSSNLLPGGWEDVPEYSAIEGKGQTVSYTNVSLPAFFRGRLQLITLELPP